MTDREAFRLSVIASLRRVHGLGIHTARAAVDEIEDVYALGLPAEDIAAHLARELRGERRIQHMGI